MGFWYELILGIYAGCITPFALIGIFEVYYTRLRLKQTKEANGQ